MVILVVVLLCLGGAALAAWRIVDDGGDNNAASAATEGDSFQSRLEETAGADEASAAEAESAESEPGADQDVYESVDYQTGEDFSYTSPDERYVTETQRHQNFFRAVAEGKVLRLEVTNADVRPVGDPNTSYIYFTLTTSDGGTSKGTFVMRLSNGMWRIAAINQLSGEL